MTTSAMSRPGSPLAARYSVERELGAGGMATVYLAEEKKHGRKVAIKVLRPELAYHSLTPGMPKGCCTTCRPLCPVGRCAID